MSKKKLEKDIYLAEGKIDTPKTSQSQKDRKTT